MAIVTICSLDHVNSGLQTRRQEREIRELEDGTKDVYQFIMPRQAIVTKYLGPTNYKGARVKAICDAGTITLPWDHALSPEGNHMAAAKDLAMRFNWLEPVYNQRMYAGSMPQCSEYAYCFVMVPNE